MGGEDLPRSDQEPGASAVQAAPAETPITAPPEAAADEQTDVATPDSVIQDSDEAAEYAYGQKPFTEAKIDHPELDVEVKEALDWLGTEAAEKAAANYRAGKEQVTDAEQAILEHAAKFRELMRPGVGREYELNNVQTYPDTPEARERALKLSEKTLAAIVDRFTKEIMDRDDLSDRDKMNKIAGLSAIQDAARQELGMSYGGGSRPYPDNPRDFVQRWSGMGNNADRLVPILWGMFAGKIGRGGQESFTVMALEEIAKLSQKPFAEVYEPVGALVAEAAVAHPAGKQFIDGLLDRNGYIWSEQRQRYLKLATEA